MQRGRADDIPHKLHRYRDAPAYYNVVHEPLREYAAGDGGPDVKEIAADLAIELERLIEALKIRDWTVNLDVQNEMRMAMDDYLWQVRSEHDLPLTMDEMDEILDRVIEVARQRDQR